MKKLNIKHILLSIVATSALLFGGWFMIHYFEQDKPIKDWIAEKEGVAVQELNVDQNQINLELSFTNKKDFGLTYIELMQYLNRQSAGKDIRITIQPDQSQNNQWWLENSAEILEAVAHQEFNQIREIVRTWTEEGKASDGQVVMNSEYIFIYIEPTGQEEIYIVLPIQWGNWKGGEQHG